MPKPTTARNTECSSRCQINCQIRRLRIRTGTTGQSGDSGLRWDGPPWVEGSARTRDLALGIRRLTAPAPAQMRLWRPADRQFGVPVGVGVVTGFLRAFGDL